MELSEKTWQLKIWYNISSIKCWVFHVSNVLNFIFNLYIVYKNLNTKMSFFFSLPSSFAFTWKLGYPGRSQFWKLVLFGGGASLWPASSPVVLPFISPSSVSHSLPFFGTSVRIAARAPSEGLSDFAFLLCNSPGKKEWLFWAEDVRAGYTDRWMDRKKGMINIYIINNDGIQKIFLPV